MSSYLSGFLPEHVTPNDVLQYVQSLNLDKCTEGQFTVLPELSPVGSIILECNLGSNIYGGKRIVYTRLYVVEGKAYRHGIPEGTRYMLSRTIHDHNVTEPFTTLVNLLFCAILHHFGVTQYVEDIEDPPTLLESTLFGSITTPVTMAQLHAKQEAAERNTNARLVMAFGHWLQKAPWFNTPLPFVYQRGQSET